MLLSYQQPSDTCIWPWEQQQLHMASFPIWEVNRASEATVRFAFVLLTNPTWGTG